MDFKFKRVLMMTASIWAAIVLAACSGGPPAISTAADEDNVGQRLQSITPVVDSNGDETQAIAIYDETAKGVHRFNVEDMTHLGFNYVSEPDQKHFVVAHPTGNYAIDLTYKHMTIFTKDGNVFRDPVRFQSTPRSAAYSASQGYLAMYDEAQTLALLKINSDGVVVKKAAKGPRIGGAMIKAGDLDNAGHLILALDNGTIAVADVEASIDDPSQWILVGGAPIASGMTNIDWVAPIFGTTRVLLHSSTTVGLWDYMARTMIATKDITGRTLVKFAKQHDPHLIFAGGSGSTSKTLVYANGNVFEERTIANTQYTILTSVLNVAANRWQMVGSDYRMSVTRDFIFWDDINYVKTNRRLRAYRFSDMLALQDLALDDRGESCLANSYLFTLMPAELGFARRQNVEDGSEKILRRFNQPYIRKN